MSTPEYDKRASRKYNEKFDRLTAYTPKGTKERIKAVTTETVNAYLCRLINEDLERCERLEKFKRYGDRKK